MTGQDISELFSPLPGVSDPGESCFGFNAVRRSASDELTPLVVVVCYVVDNLRPATLYAFQVRTWNLVSVTPIEL